ncbi:Protein phosphatase PTC7 [Nymphon striatum]|nr:Protein phosphatase PTC7 [Nymphon striatum]
MQSLMLYGRLLSRAAANSVQNYAASSEIHSYSKRKLACEPVSSNQQKQLQFLTASCGFPKDFTKPSHLIKKGQFGEDAYFSTKNHTADAIGVADGVGGWKTYGVDSSVFSCTLMKSCEHLVNTGQFNPKEPERIIARSFYDLIECKEEINGSSTACIMVLDKSDQTVHTANIGDSGFLVVRSGEVLHRSEEQIHYFNTPHQLSQPPSDQSFQVLSDSPDTADTSSFKVQEGDLILLATDGLFDNVPDNMIINELSKLKDCNREKIQATVNSLALQARVLAFDSSYMSPFSKRAQQHGINTIGGKPDDITIILALVST